MTILNGDVMIAFTNGVKETMIKKFLFWMLVFGVGFVNPLFSVALIVLYYLPGIIQDACQPCSEEQVNSGMKSFSEDILEEMK